MRLGVGIGTGLSLGNGGVNWNAYWLTRTPTNLALTNIGYPEGIQLDWLNAGAGYHGTSIERSADGVTYAEIDTVASGVLTYQDTTAVFQTEYYYRVRAYKGTNYSPYSNAESLEVTSDRFIITVDTTKAGSANDTFIWRTAVAGTYDYYVDWGDGGAEEHIVAVGNQTHVYASSGTYQIRMRGTMHGFIYDSLGDCDKIISLDNWGDIQFITINEGFKGCRYLVNNAKDAPDLSLCTDCGGLFRNCDSLTNVFNPTFDTSKSYTLSWMFYESSPLPAQSLAWLSIQGVSAAGNLFGIIAINVTINVPGTSANYDATLISWASQAVTHSKTNKTLGMGVSKYGEGLVDSGTTDGVSAGKLIQSGQNFLTTVTVGDVVYNTTDGTYAFVTGIDSDTQLSISVDIMASGEVYRIQHSDAAKARAQLVIPVVNGGQGWTLTDGGYL